ASTVLGLRVTPEFFETFGVRPMLGRVFSAIDSTGPPSIVVSYGFWQRQLAGSHTTIGTTLTLSDVTYEVIGGMPPDCDVRLLDQREGAAFWTVLSPNERGYDAAGIGPVAIIARLTDGITLDAARSEVTSITRHTESRYQLNFNQFAVSLSSL